MAANYWLTTNAKFRPFSYDEMIKPVEKMYTEHKGIEEGLSELQVKAGIWEGLANQQSDPVTYAQYKRYADELRMAADDLAMNGLNATSRQNLFNMKARYASEITPIELWYARRDKLDEEQRKLKAQDPSLMFDNDFSTMSLDRFKENPRLSYTAISGNTIATKASGMLNNLAKAIETEPQYKSILGGQYFQVAQRTGLNTAQILALAQDNPEVLYSIAKRDEKGNILESEKKGIEDLMKLGSTIRGTIHNSLRGNAAYNPNKDNIDSYITEGFLTAGAGGTSYSTMQDQRFVDPAKAASIKASNASTKATLTKLAWEEADRKKAETPIMFDDGTYRDASDITGGNIPYKVVGKNRVYQSGSTSKINETKSGGSSSKSSSGSKSSGSSDITRLAHPVMIKVKTTGELDARGRVKVGGKASRQATRTTIYDTGFLKPGEEREKGMLGNAVGHDYSDLPIWAKEEADREIKGDSPDSYDFSIVVSKGNKEAYLYIEPRENKKEIADDYGGSGEVGENAH